MNKNKNNNMDESPKPLRKTRLCRPFQTGTCSNSAVECAYLHIKEEDLKKKTEMCQNIEKYGFCKHSISCNYAHNKQELQSKTICNFFNNGGCTNGDKCKFRHVSDTNFKIIKTPISAKDNNKKVTFVTGTTSPSPAKTAVKPQAKPSINPNDIPNQGTNNNNLTSGIPQESSLLVQGAWKNPFKPLTTANMPKSMPLTNNKISIPAGGSSAPPSAQPSVKPSVKPSVQQSAQPSAQPGVQKPKGNVSPPPGLSPQPNVQKIDKPQESKPEVSPIVNTNTNNGCIATFRLDDFKKERENLEVKINYLNEFIKQAEELNNKAKVLGMNVDIVFKN